jgi:uncharacterized protein (TIGR03000 family)
MFTLRKDGVFLAAPLCLLVLAAVGPLAASPALDGGPAYGVPSGLPWFAGYRGYAEPPRLQPPPPAVTAAPQKYEITVIAAPQKAQGTDPNAVILMAHLPEDALIWFEDQPTNSRGAVRVFESPPLTPGRNYHYTARVVWNENGQWVSQTATIPIRAGEFHCLDLTWTGDKDARIAANLAKLSSEDRELAEAQRVCAVQRENRLGVMGVPVKVTVRGKPVFLCCEGCVKHALANPERTLAELKKLKAIATGSPRK